MIWCGGVTKRSVQVTWTLFAGLFTEDAVWHLGGSGGLSGDKQGLDAILAYFGELFTRSDGTIKVDLDDLIGGENHTVGFQSVHAQRNGAAIDHAPLSSSHSKTAKSARYTNSRRTPPRPPISGPENRQLPGGPPAVPGSFIARVA